MDLAARLRVGLVGAGWFATRRHLPNLQSHSQVDLVAICRRDQEKLGLIADHFNIPGRYRDFDDMLHSERLDAVVIATPHSLHYPQAKVALDRGLHVLLEKPMTLRAREAEALVEKAAEGNHVLSVALNPPYWPHTRYARDLIGEGTIGQIEGISIQWIGNSEGVFGLAPLPDEMPGLVKPSLYRGDHALSGGGHLMDTGSHLISECLWLSRLRPVKVAAQMDDTKLDMRIGLQVCLSGDVHAGINCVGNSSFDGRRIRNVYYGTKGTLTIEGLPFSVTIDLQGRGSIQKSENEMDEAPGPVEDFVLAINEGREPASTGRHGADVVRVLEAAYRSAESGACVKINGL